MCDLDDPEDRAAGFATLYELHRPLGGLRVRIHQLDPMFHYEHLASCAE